MSEKEKIKEYSMKILASLNVLFDQDNENAITDKEFSDKENVTLFFHALANVGPTILYNEVTGDKKNYLEFNHIANKLCFQYMESE
jgi:hypothetical protein